MSYIESTLLPDEKIIFRTRPHFYIFVTPILLAVLGIGILHFLHFEYANYAAYAILFFAAYAGLTTYIQYIYTEYVVTNKRIIAKTGWLSRRTHGIMVQRVESVHVYQPLIGRVLGYGNVIVVGSGGTEDIFPGINAAFELRNAIVHVLSKFHSSCK